MSIRKPIVAGQFYPGTSKGCEAEIDAMLPCEAVKVNGMPQWISAGIVPHAGWLFSGNLAVLVFSAILQQNKHVDTFVIFGAAHRHVTDLGGVYEVGSWETPLGRMDIDCQLAKDICNIEGAESNQIAHLTEHSIEVQLPIIQYLFPQAKIVPVTMPPGKWAVKVGKAVGDMIAEIDDKKIVCIASTDLTHYGASYGFVPEGVGISAINWAKHNNDKKLIDSALNMDAEKVLDVADKDMSACGAGAVAAVISAAEKLGVISGKLLAHTHSSEVLKQKFNRDSEESVGYAAIVY